MKIVFWGTPDYAVPSLEALINNGHEILAVVTQPDKRRGRGNKLCPSPVKMKAQELGLSIITTNSIQKDMLNKEIIKNLNAEIYVVVAFGQLLPVDILDHPPYGSWNSHGSLLPRWRGAGPIQWSILSGDKQTGVSIMLMEEGLDTGPVLLEQEINIDLHDNYSALSKKLSLLSAATIVKALIIIETAGICTRDERLKLLNLRLQEDDVTKITYARSFIKEDRRINWEQKPIKIHKQIMAFHPNAYTYYNKKILKIEVSEPLNLKDSQFKEDLALDKSKKEKPGYIIGTIDSKGLVVSCGENAILIKKAKLEGKSTLEGNRLIQQLSNRNNILTFTNFS